MHSEEYCNRLHTRLCSIRFGVFKALLVQIQVFWDVT